MYRHWESLSISLLIHLLILTQNYFAVRALYPRRKRGGFTARSDKMNYIGANDVYEC